ncbi:MAG: AAA domain-containing protein, partial [Thiohalomonadales bacterium]
GYSDETISHALNSALVENIFDEFDAIIDELINPETVRYRTLQYFSDFSSSDVYTDLLELRKTLKVKENNEVYLYLCDLHFDKRSYPLFYLPLEVRLEESIFTLSAKPHLYINKRAIDYVIQEIARANKTTATSVIKDRIIYLNKDDVFCKVMQSLLDEWDSALMLRPPINILNVHPQKAHSAMASITNSVYLSAFERSDEALINDYEALLDMADSDSPIFKDFQQLILGFLKTEPVSINKCMDTQWSGMPMEDRLVCRAPIPMNEEQRKIANAIYDNKCRLISVSGPPGTGKSHTIVSLAFEAILNKRNVLVLSDKIEALDVVEDKLKETLNSVRLEEDFQNPILRFGRSNNTYAKILSNQSIERIRRHHRVAAAKKIELEQELNGIEQSLKGKLRKMVEYSDKIDIKDIFAFEQCEQAIEEIFPGLQYNIANKNLRFALTCTAEIAHTLAKDNFKVFNLLTTTHGMATLIGLQLFARLNKQLEHDTLDKLVNGQQDVLSFFTAFEEPMIATLEKFILRYEDLRTPLFGYFFKG